ncbi:hypothetical protein CSB96_2629 [Pseudomonas aeruginosa]|nr:hypothetical protein CSB96_2629 [Pseudomonas aeruginosa]
MWGHDFFARRVGARHCGLSFPLSHEIGKGIFRVRRAGRKGSPALWSTQN